MTEQAKVPAIRFAGFTDPWEQRKLGELFEESDERASDREILSVSVANGIYPASESDRETNPGASLANYKIVHFGDVVYNSMRMWQGAVDASRYDGIVSPAYVVARPNSEVYARFFARLLRQPMLLKQYQQVSQGNSKDTQVLKFDDFASIGISMPASENEQRRIGGFFDRLDSLITLHQRKYDKLVIFKKSMLEKMFPKDGESVPEIRFAGFTDPWEQRKLGEIADKVTEKNLDGNITEVLTNSAEYGVINQTEFFDHAVAKESNIAGYYVIAPGDFVYNPRISATAPVGPIRRNTLGIHGVMSPLYTVFRLTDAVDGTYLSHFFKTNGWHGFMKLEGNSGARSDRFSIGDATFFEMPIPVPSSSEQYAIGSFFSRLDDLITLHQRKLELLQNIKKSLLDKMFV
ncbi:restriction endonuclease S subunit [Bifidobacterium longum subsp. longum]|uniref:restriction endonuclease subunit S n=2 Tax=Bifidobacterium longum TaxID=216816 RepID=UPI00103A9DF7|nr:restriction endonuclease S subunit [Bifidobacterium longum subsp. longum]